MKMSFKTFPLTDPVSLIRELKVLAPRDKR